MAKYEINHSNGSILDIYDLEQNGPNNISSPRQILNISNSGAIGTHNITISGDLTYRFTVGQVFNIIASGGNDGSYTTISSSLNINETNIIVVEAIPSSSLPIGDIQYSLPVSENSTSLLFPGRGVLNFGNLLIQNSLNLLENFSNTTAPINPITGQSWYKSDTNELFNYDSNNTWVSTRNLGNGTISFTDLQHPTDQINSILELTGDDSDVGLSLKILVDPNSTDSIFRVLTSTESEILRVEFDGYTSTSNSIKSLGTTLPNTFANDIEIPNNKSISSTAGSKLSTSASGNTWEISNSTNTTVLSIQNNASSNIISFDQNIITAEVDLLVNPTNNTLFVDISANAIGIGNNNPSERLDVSGNIKSSGQILSANGTTFNPGISFASNTSIGLKLSGTNLIFTNSGNDLVTLNSSGIMSFNTPNYEVSISSPNDIPNKKYVDDSVISSGGTSRSKLYFFGFGT